MGNEVSTVTNGVGDLLGNAFMAPLKSIFGQSCEGICSGPWDFLCFIEHLCISNILRLMMILVLCYITLLFFYILFKLGLCQCIGKSLCRMCWGACEMYWFALEDVTCFLWHKLLSTKRVNRRRRRRRRRFRDIERGYDYSSSDETENDLSGIDSGHATRHKTRAARFQGKSRNPRKPKSRDVNGGSYRLRSARRIRLSKVRNVELSQTNTFKRRRLK